MSDINDDLRDLDSHLLRAQAALRGIAITVLAKPGDRDPETRQMIERINSGLGHIYRMVPSLASRLTKDQDK